MPYYRCLYKQDYGYVGEASKHPDAVYLRGDKLEIAIDSWFAEKVFSKDRLMYLTEDFAKLNGDKTVEREQRIKEIQRKIQQTETKLRKQKESIEKALTRYLLAAR